MRLGGKILITFVAVVVVGIAAGIVFVRTHFPVTTKPVRGTSVTWTGTDTSRTWNVTGFSTLTAEGAVQVDVYEGSSFSVTAQGTPRTLKRVSVESSGDVLIVHSDGVPMSNSDYDAIVNVTVPTLAEVRVSGASRVQLQSVGDPSRFTVTTVGASTIKAWCRFRKLELTAQGASSLEFGSAPSRSANVNLQGASSATVRLEGGELSGLVVGASRLVYLGSVSNNSVVSVGSSIMSGEAN